MLVERGGILANENPAGSSVLWLPTQFGNLLYWGRADRGVSTVGPATPDPSTWSLAGTNMTRTLAVADPFGGNQAVRFTDTADGGPTVHQVNAGNIGQLGPNISDVWIQPFGNRFNFFAMQPSTSVISYLDWTLGTFSVPTVGRVLETRGNWFHVRLYNTGNNQPGVTVYTANAVGSVSYTGLANYGFDLYLPSVSQDLITAWADQSGNGYTFTQGVAAAQGFYQEIDPSGFVIPKGQGGVPQLGVSFGGSTTHSLSNAALGPIMTGTGVPHTAVMLDQYLGNAGGVVQWYGNSPGAGLQIANNGSPTVGKICTAITENSGVQHNTISTTGFTTGIWSTYASSYDGNAVRQYVNNSALDASSPNVIGAITETIPAMFIGFNNGWHREITLFGRALSASEIRAVMNGMRGRWLLPLI